MTNNNGNTWNSISTALPNNVSITALSYSGSNIFACTENDGVFLSSNNGSSWSGVNSGLASSHVFSIAITGNNIFVGTDSGVYLSTNNGSSWTALNNGLPSSITIQSLTISAGVVFAGSVNNNVFISSDNGSSWTNNFLLGNGDIRALGSSGNKVLASTGMGVYLSTNGGSGWSQVNNGIFTGYFIYAFSFSGNNFFAGASNGAFISSNNGNSWSTMNTGFSTGTNVNSLYTNTTNIFAGTAYAGVWINSLASVGIDEKNEIGNINIYPNPFTSQTTVSFSEYQNNSSIKIFDLQGKVIKSMMFSGKEFELEKDAMQAGMYLMQITDDKQNFTSEKILIQ